MSDRSGIFAGDDPFAILQQWMDDATQSEPSDPNAMTLATVDADGMPDLRIVLLKGIEDGALVFYTNYTSRKSEQLIQSGKAAINFHWKTLARQARFRGTITKTSEDVSDAYYASRPLGSRIGAWASDQSKPLSNKQALVDRVAHFEEEFGPNPPRPAHWGGFRLVPNEIEFWAAGEFRLHDRFRWARQNCTTPWQIDRLNP